MFLFSVFLKEIVRELNRLGMLIDLSHSSVTTARDVMEASVAPVIFSHSATKSLCNNPQNVPDDLLDSLVSLGYVRNTKQDIFV